MRHAHACGHPGDTDRRSYAPWLGHWERHFYPGDPFGTESGVFGVRRPLRFLAWRLQLDERQLAEIAAALNELKTERAQAAVDDRRTLTAFADAVAGESFDEARAGEAAGERVKSAERLQGTVAKSLGRIHALLNPEQRSRLAYLIRTGALAL
jgi:Spy/CpxP family protein refolding chaperone